MIKLTTLIRQILEEEQRDRCLRIADRKYDKPSAYKSGAVVRCRKGDIWKDLKETRLSDLTDIEPYNDSDDEYAQNLDQYLVDDGVDWKKESYITLLNPHKISPSEWNYLSDNPRNPKSLKFAQQPLDKFKPILALKTGNDTYEAIDGIHRTYAFRLRNYMIPAIVITPKLEQSLNTTDTQMVNFMYNKYQNANIPTPVPNDSINEDESLHRYRKEYIWKDLKETNLKSVYTNVLTQTEEEALKLVDRNWDRFGGEECNNGFCDIFAQNLSKYLPGSKIMSTEDDRSSTFGHVWIEYRGKYYDAETPNGVSSWKELPWMINFFNKNKEYPADVVYLKEVRFK